MKHWLLRISVVLCALVVVTTGSWWSWREWYSADQIRAAKEAGDAEKVCRLLRWGARADEAENLLHWAAQYGHPAVAELLLANGAEVYVRNSDGWMPLHMAAVRDNPAVAELLLANGAKVDAKDTTHGSTPLHQAAAFDSLAMAKFLLANGADPNAKTTDGKTPLDLWPEFAEIVQKLQAEEAKDKK